MQIRAGNPTVGRYGTIRFSIDDREWPAAILSYGDAEVDLIAGKRCAVFRRHGDAVPHRLFRRHLRLDVQQPEAGDLRGVPLDAQGIMHLASEHLIAAADADDPPAPLHMGQKIGIPTLHAHIRQVGDRRFRTGQNHQSGIRRQPLAGANKNQLDIRFCRQRIQIVEIRDAGKDRYCDLQRGRAASCQALQRHRVLGGQPPSVLQPWHDAEAWPSRKTPHRIDSGIEERNVTTKLVDDVAGYHCPVVIGEDGMRADQRGDHAATIDVADHHHRHAGARRKSHIGDITGPEIDFGRRARTFHDHEIRSDRNLRKALHHVIEECRLELLIVPSLGLPPDLALNDDLAAVFGLRLEQHRVHVHRGRHPRSERLQPLRPADLTAVVSDSGIVRHVLRLEGTDRKAVIGSKPAKPRNKNGLADIGAGTLQHDGLGHCRGTPENSPRPTTTSLLRSIAGVENAKAASTVEGCAACRNTLARSPIHGDAHVLRDAIPDPEKQRCPPLRNNR